MKPKTNKNCKWLNNCKLKLFIHRRKDERTTDSNFEKGEYRENRSTESK